MQVCVLNLLLVFVFYQFFDARNTINKLSNLFCRKMDADKVKQVLDRPSTYINAVDASGRSALHIAAIKDSPECIEMLIDHRKKGILKFIVSKIKTEAENADLCLKDRNGDTPLSLAVKYNSFEAVNVILSKLKSSSLIDRVDWNETCANCQSLKMQQILEKHYQPIHEMTGESIIHLFKVTSNDCIVLRLPNTFKYLLSLCIDKLLCTFPSPMVFLSKITWNRAKVYFKQIKIRNDSILNSNPDERLDCGVDVNYASLIDDILFEFETIKTQNCNATNIMKYAHEYVCQIVKRKLPVL